MPVIQPLPVEIQEQVDKLTAFISQCEGEILSSQKTVDNWAAQKATAQNKVKALKAKYAEPVLTVWPAEVITP